MKASSCCCCSLSCRDVKGNAFAVFTGTTWAKPQQQQCGLKPTSRGSDSRLAQQCNGQVSLLPGATTLFTARPRRCKLRVVRKRGLVPAAVGDEEQPTPVQPDEQGKPFYSSKLFRVGVVVFLTSGFVDAGYSGDWSRIGAITTEVEAALRLAAVVVVPTSALVLWLIAKTDD